MAPFLARGIRRIQWSLRKHGFSGTLGRLPRVIRPKPRDEAWFAYIEDQDEDFDEKYCVDTSGLTRLRELSVVGKNWTAGVDYQGIGARLCHQVFSQLRIDHGNFTFVDLGCGKGRPLLLAAAYPFGRIVGVEFAPELAEVARRNLENYTGPRVCDKVEVVCADAASYELPAGPLVVFMYNPFDERVMQPVIQNIFRSAVASAYPSYVIYCNPRFSSLFDPTRLQVVADVTTGDGYMIWQVLPERLAVNDGNGGSATPRAT